MLDLSLSYQQKTKGNHRLIYNEIHAITKKNKNEFTGLIVEEKKAYFSRLMHRNSRAKEGRKSVESRMRM
jgi:hypothetical protein